MTKDAKAKAERMKSIKHILNMVEDKKCLEQLIIPNLDRVMEMISYNIFRPLPNIKRLDLDKKETGIDQEEVSDPAWPYL